ncbi:MAG: sulfotransferase [Gammaproteobacteria bacterium]|nr:sulfotransferase [Gammaproteobacteria bacterium]
MAGDAGRHPGLNRAALMAQAEQDSGLSHWGVDRTFEEGLDRLVDAVEAMPFAAALREAVATQVTQLLATRLQLEEDARQQPEILRGEICRPLIVLGLPRTGTTWLFELLALDQGARAPLTWEAAAPWPAPELATFATDPRIRRTQAGFDAMLQAVPELATMHPFGATVPAECNAITQLHFASSNFWAAYDVPDYLRWLTEAPAPGAMNIHRRVLQQLQWKGPKGRWVLKSPPYLLMLEDLLAAYPDACLVQTHREPAKMVASLANMIRALRRARYPDIADLLEPESIARSVLYHFGTALQRGVTSREDPGVESRFLDIAYRDLVRDPVGTVRRIYDRFDLPWTAALDERLKSHINRRRSTGHGKHIYDPAEFDIDALNLPDRFPEYRARFGDLLADSVAD